jgi:hypothetical protein
MTVGELRSALAGLPDSAPLYPEWHDRIPSDSEPGVRLHGVQAVNGEAQVLVSLFYLDEDTGNSGEEDE